MLPSRFTAKLTKSFEKCIMDKSASHCLSLLARRIESILSNTILNLFPIQPSHFKNDDFFKKIARESEVRYIGHKDLHHEERIKLFYQECKNCESLDIAIVSTGTSVKLSVCIYVKYHRELQYILQRRQMNIDVHICGQTDKSTFRASNRYQNISSLSTHDPVH